MLGTIQILIDIEVLIQYVLNYLSQDLATQYLLINSKLKYA